MRVRLIACLGLLIGWFAGTAAADPISLVTLGDSLTDPYANHAGSLNPVTGLPYWGYGGNKNWVEQLQSLRAADFTISNLAKAGATSGDVLTQGQPTAAAALVHNGQANYASLIVGANDVLAYLQSPPGTPPVTFLQTLATHVGATLDALHAGGPVKAVVGNIPDLAVTPYFKAAFAGNPAALGGLSGIVQAANQAIEQQALARGLPVLDLFKLSHAVSNPLSMAGTTVGPDHMFAPDLFHPATVPQGLLADTFLYAIHDRYGANVDGLPLSDQEILTLAKVPYPISDPTLTNPTGQTYFDVSGFVIEPPHATPEPSTLVLLLAAGPVAGFPAFRRRVARPV